jgi:hypothetical protein
VRELARRGTGEDRPQQPGIGGVDRREEDAAFRVAANRSASMPVLPVTKICSYGIRSRTRFSSFVEVGARWNEAIRETTWRFSSSGNGLKVERVRRPASTWTTGIRRLNDAIAAESADEVSPCTRVATGKPPSRIWSRVAIAAPVAANCSRQNPSSRRITVATRSFRVRPGRPTSRSTSGVMSASARIGSTRSLCWPVVATIGLKFALARRASTTGNILIASGRVPIRQRTFAFGGCSSTLLSSSSGRDGSRPA